MIDPEEFFVAPIYGGSSIREQKDWLKQGTDIVISTTDRLLQHIERK